MQPTSTYSAELAAPQQMPIIAPGLLDLDDIEKHPVTRYLAQLQSQSSRVTLQGALRELAGVMSGGKTRLILRGKPINATPQEEEFFASMHDSMQQGFGGTFDQPVEYLAQAAKG